MTQTSMPIAILAAMILSLPSRVLAETRSYCVSCAGPDQVYDCRLDVAAGTPDDATLLLYCVGELARRNGHASCKAQRVQSSPCGGVAEDVVYGGPMPPASEPQPAVDAAAATPASVPPQQADTAGEQVVPDEPPKTLVELTERTVKSVDDSLARTGKTIGEAAKSTWSCITSLFSDCN